MTLVYGSWISTHAMRLAVAAILRGRFGDLTVTMAVCCSSWITTSRGSTWRSIITPLGNTNFASVRLANLLASRQLGVFTLDTAPQPATVCGVMLRAVYILTVATEWSNIQCLCASLDIRPCFPLLSPGWHCWPS